MNEHSEQRLVVEHLRASGIPIFAVPNGAMLGGRNKFALLSKLRAEGLANGAPDLVVVALNKHERPTAIEMKTKGRKASDEQRRFLREMEYFGWTIIVANGYDDAIAKLRKAGYRI